MNKKFVLFILPLLLVGCAKTDELYVENAYNSPIFDENYYTIYDKAPWIGDPPVPCAQEPVNVSAINFEGDFETYGYENCLSKQNDAFKEGILSKLYDGRTRCDGLYQRSRVQLDKGGFGTLLPAKIEKATSFGFAARGGSTCESPLLLSNVEFTFYVDIWFENQDGKQLKNFVVNDVTLPTDYNSATGYRSFEFNELTNILYYSIRFELKTNISGVTDNKEDTTKEHLAIMLYEVIIK